MSSQPPDLSTHMAAVLGRAAVLLPPLRAFEAELPVGRQRRQLARVLSILERNDANEAAATLGTLPEYWIPLLSAATASQDPERILRQFLDESGQAADLQRQKWQSRAYPLAVVSLAAVVFTALSFFVIPTFQKMIQEFQLRVPFLTALLFSVAGWITHGAALIAILIGGLLFILASRLLRWLPSPVGDPLGRILASLVGRPTAVARFAQFTADLLEAQFQVPQALRLAGHCSRDRRLGPAAAQLADELERGGWPASQFVCGALTQTIVFAVSGDLPRTARIRLLREVSKCHGQRAQARLSWSRGVYEPLAIVLIGAVVGWTVLALFMPLVTLINGLS